MKHKYYGIYDRVAGKYVHVCESENHATMTRMCNILAKDSKTFVGQAPGDYVAYYLADFDDENGKFAFNAEHESEILKVWEGKPNE